MASATALDVSMRYVILGAGNLGQKVAAALQQHGFPVPAFCDNNQALWGASVNGIPVVSPARAASDNVGATFIVAIWHPSVREGLQSHFAALRALGCLRIISFAHVFWAFPQLFLPNMFWEQPEKLRLRQAEADRACALLDERGQDEFRRQWNFRLHGDPVYLQAPEPTPQYFPPDFLEMSDRERFVDCGAFDGDTLEPFLHAAGNRFAHYHAFEPEPGNLAQLHAAVARRGDAASRISIYPYAVGARNETLAFSSAGDGSSISAAGDIKVECVALDSVLENESPTYIKMDIEGFELEALAGAAATIRRCRPKLAVCVYHHPEHIWRVPMTLAKMLPGSRLTLRSYQQDGRETVCYCRPEPSPASRRSVI